MSARLLKHGNSFQEQILSHFFGGLLFRLSSARTLSCFTDDEFLRIHKLGEGQYSTSLVASVRFAPLLEHITVVPQLPAHVWYNYAN